MAYPQGITFRNTLAFVTDISPDEFEPATQGISYPRTTALGNSVGWETDSLSSRQFRDRNAANDARLAGTGFEPGADDTYRFDLRVTGNHNIRVAAGEAFYARSTAISLKDTTTLLGTLSQTATTAPNNFRDAIDAEYSAAAWPGSNTAAAFTFATTICRFIITGGDGCYVAHLYVEEGTPAASGVTWLPQGQTSGQGRDQIFPSGMQN